MRQTSRLRTLVVSGMSTNSNALALLVIMQRRKYIKELGSQRRNATFGHWVSLHWSCLVVCHKTNAEVKISSSIAIALSTAGMNMPMAFPVQATPQYRAEYRSSTEKILRDLGSSSGRSLQSGQSALQTSYDSQIRPKPTTP
jgi:hypothetical protein